jgi:hypothetical protein
VTIFVAFVYNMVYFLFLSFCSFFYDLVLPFCGRCLNPAEAYVLVSNAGLSSRCPLHRYTPPFRQHAFFIGHVKLRPRLIWALGFQLAGEGIAGLSSRCPLHRYTPPFRQP